jgi:cold shock CspA family protein
MNKTNTASGANAASRFHGKLVKWNTDRGFGFVVADQGGQELFVHVSAFPRDGRPPVIGESLSFELELDKEGRKRAVRLRRPGAPPRDVARRQAREPHHTPTRRESGTSGASRLATVVVALLVAAGVGWLGYTRHHERADVVPLAAPPAAMVIPAQTLVPEAPSSAFQCDGRKHCSQMTSCREATQFLQNCPGMEMDGDGDGIPCEQQWCTGSGG